MEFSKIFAGKVKRAGLHRVAGYHAYHAIWLAKFRYSAPMIGITSNQVKKIYTGVLSSCLSAGGYSNKMPRAVVFGPTILGGMDWDNPLIIYLYEKIKMLVGSIRLKDTVGRLMLMQISWLQLFAGTGTPLLESNFDINYLPKGWIRTVQRLLVEFQVKIKIYTAWKPTKQRQQDRIIMDYVTQHIPKWAWEGINTCRLYMKATTVTDIATIDGRFIPDHIRNVKSPIRDSKIQFPIQCRPSKQDIEQWQYFVDSISHNRRLHIQLGKWVRTPDQHYDYMSNSTQTVVYKRTQQLWKEIGRASCRERV